MPISKFISIIFLSYAIIKEMIKEGFTLKESPSKIIRIDLQTLYTLYCNTLI
jgi:hypothetical protein